MGTGWAADPLKLAGGVSKRTVWSNLDVTNGLLPHSVQPPFLLTAGRVPFGGERRILKLSSEWVGCQNHGEQNTTVSLTSLWLLSMGDLFKVGLDWMGFARPRGAMQSKLQSQHEVQRVDSRVPPGVRRARRSSFLWGENEFTCRAKTGSPGGNPKQKRETSQGPKGFGQIF